MDTSEKTEDPPFSNKISSLIYLNADVGSVFDSQVAHLLISQSKTLVFSRVVLLCGIKNKVEKIRVSNALKKTEVEVFFFKSYPNYPFYNKIQQKAILAALEEVRADADCHIHIRGELLAASALKPILRIAKKLDNVVVDIRGAGYEELAIYFKASLWKIFAKKINYQIAFKRLRNYHKISVVSAALKEYIHKNAQIPKTRIKVIHCLAGENFIFNEESRERVRNSLGLNNADKLLVFSSGGNAGWQNTRGLKSLLSNKWTILNLSKEVIDEEGIINKFIPYAEVPDYLNASDAAIIFRDENIVNEVACPVKFCEYVCCGLPVISNKAVKEIAHYIEKSETGKVLHQDKEIHSIDMDLIINVSRLEASVNARNTYGDEVVVKQYLNLYFKSS